MRVGVDPEKYGHLLQPEDQKMEFLVIWKRNRYQGFFGLIADERLAQINIGGFVDQFFCSGRQVHEH